MPTKTVNHSSSIQSTESKELVASLANQAITRNALVDTFNVTVKNQSVTTKQTIEHIAATIDWWVSTRVYCDKDVYKWMYQKVLAQGTILKHQIETMKKHMNTMKKKTTELSKITENYYNGLCNLVTSWENKVKESTFYPDNKIGFNTNDWNAEIESLYQKVDVMNKIGHTVEDILYMNQLT